MNHRRIGPPNCSFTAAALALLATLFACQTEAAFGPEHDHKPTNVSNINELGNSDPFGLAAGDKVCYLFATDGSGDIGVHAYAPVIKANGTIDYGQKGVTSRLGGQSFSDPRHLTVVPANPSHRETLFLAARNGSTDVLWRWNGAWSSLVAETDSFERIDAICWSGDQLFVQGGIENGRVMLRRVTNARAGEMAYETLLPGMAATGSSSFGVTNSLIRFVLENDSGHTLYRYFVGEHTFAAAAIANVRAIGLDLYFTATREGTNQLYSWPAIRPTPTVVPIDPLHFTDLEGKMVAATATQAYRVRGAEHELLPFPENVTVLQIHALTTWQERIYLLARTNLGEMLFRLDGEAFAQAGRITDELKDPRGFLGLDHSLNLIDRARSCWNIYPGLGQHYQPESTTLASGTIGELTYFRGMVLFSGRHATKGEELYRWWSEPPHRGSDHTKR